MLPHELFREGGESFGGKGFRFGEDQPADVPHQRVEQPGEDFDIGVIVVHNRPLSPFVVVDHAGFVATGAMLRRGAAEARKHGFERVADFRSPFPEPGAVAG